MRDTLTVLQSPHHARAYADMLKVCVGLEPRQVAGVIDVHRALLRVEACMRLGPEQGLMSWPAEDWEFLGRPEDLATWTAELKGRVDDWIRDRRAELDMCIAEVRRRIDQQSQEPGA